MKHIDDVMLNLAIVTDKIKNHDLTPFYDARPDWDLGTVQINWMLQGDSAAARKVISAFPGHWKVHPGSDRHDMILEFESPTIEITLWCPKDTVRLNIEVPS